MRVGMLEKKLTPWADKGWDLTLLVITQTSLTS